MKVKDLVVSFSKFLFNDEYTFNQKMMNLCLFTGVFGGLIELLCSIWFKYNEYVFLFIGGVVLFAALGLLISIIGKKPTLASYIFTTVTNLILLPCIYYFNGGLDCGCVFWMLLAITLPWLFFRGIHRFISGIVGIAGITLTLVISAVFPELIQSRENMNALMAEYIASMIIVSFIYAVLFRYQAALFERQNKKIQEAMEKAEKASEAKTSFLSNVTHDARIPLNSIIGFTELARQNNENKAFLFDCLGKISVSSEQLLGLMNQMLDVSQIESGITPMEMDTASINSITEKLKKILEPELAPKNLTLDIDLSSVRDDTVICDSLHLTQVLINILSNAIKYSHSDGKIDFTVVQNSNLKNGKVNMDFIIKDYGIGMSEEFCNHIFEPFQKDEKSNAKSKQRTGLGLHIAKSFVDMMNGKISVSSELGKGSEFIINLNFDVPILSEIPYEISDKSVEFEGKRVLLVDDNVENLEITSALLKDNGFVVELAESGSAAIDKIIKADEEYYDLILMDVNMPEKDGYETTKIIRSLDKKHIKDLPIIALSAYDYEDDRHRALECGMNGYITKPFSIKELFKLLEFILIDDKKKHIFKKF